MKHYCLPLPPPADPDRDGGEDRITDAILDGGLAWPLEVWTLHARLQDPYGTETTEAETYREAIETARATLL